MPSGIEVALMLQMMQIFAYAKLNWNHATVLTEILFADHKNHHRLIVAL